jgi:hypothetical protein
LLFSAAFGMGFGKGCATVVLLNKVEIMGSDDVILSCRKYIAQVIPTIGRANVHVQFLPHMGLLNASLQLSGRTR